ncbi:MAG: hypothetical protein WCQ49_02390 [Candidatus Saccharibacteria bacterium]
MVWFDLLFVVAYDYYSYYHKFIWGRNMIKKNILQVMGDKEMDRKDFLKYSGLVVLGLVGFKTIANLLAGIGDKKVVTAEPRKQVTRGFGGGKYGS